MDQQDQTSGGKQQRLPDLHAIAGRGRHAAEVIKALDYIHEYRARGFGLDLISIFTPVYIISGLLATHDYPGLRLEYFLFTSISLACYLLVFSGWSFADRARYKQFLSEVLTFDAALELVEQGGPELGRIHGWIPWPFSMFFSRRPPDTTPARMRLLANNIDWYLDEPRVLIRWHWVAKALITLLAVPHAIALVSLSPQVASPWEPPVLIMVSTITVMLLAVLLSIDGHSRLREGLRVEVLHDLVKPYLASLVAAGARAEAELPATGPDENPADLDTAPVDWLLYAVSLVAGITYIILRLAHAAPVWLHRPVNILIAVVTWFFAAQLISKKHRPGPIPRMNYWLFALYPAVASVLGFAVTGLIEDLNYHVLELQFLYLLVCVAGVLPVAARLLRIQREKLGEFVAGLAVWNILVFGIIGLIAVVLNYSGYTLRPGA